MGLRELFEKAQVAITFAEADLHDDARRFLSEEAPPEERREPGKPWSAGCKDLEVHPAGG